MRRILKRLIIGLALIIMLLIYLILQYDVYVLSDYTCGIALMCTPDEFISNGGASALGGGYTFAKLDKDGNLFLILSTYEKKMWSHTYKYEFALLDILTNKDKQINYSAFSEFEQKHLKEAHTLDIQVSDNYQKVSSCKDVGLLIIEVVPACLEKQVIDGINHEDVYLEVIILNEDGSVLSRYSISDAGWFDIIDTQQ